MDEKQEYFDSLDKKILRNPNSNSVVMQFRDYVDILISRRDSGRRIGNGYGRDYLRTISAPMCTNILDQHTHIVIPPGIIPDEDMGIRTMRWQQGALLLNYHTYDDSNAYHVLQDKGRKYKLIYSNRVNLHPPDSITTEEIYNLMRDKKNIWWFDIAKSECKRRKNDPNALLASIIDPRKSALGRDLYQTALKLPGIAFLPEQTERRDQQLIESMLKSHISGAVKTFVELCDLSKTQIAQLLEFIEPLDLPYVPTNPSRSNRTTNTKRQP